MADGASPCPTKTCTRCGETKAATALLFYVDRGARDGLQSACKACRYQPRAYPKRPPEPTRKCSSCGEIKPATFEFFARKITGWMGLYGLCKVCDAQRAAQYRVKKPPDYGSPTRAAASRRWRTNNLERARDLARKHQNRRREDGRYRASSAMSCRIWRSLKDKGGTSWEKFVGYTRGELVTHLERQFDRRMSWSNFGRVWHIDHIRPVSSFAFSGYDDQEFRDCWALSNLRPLPKRENLVKRDHRTHLI